MELPSISIIIPCYNKADFIAETLDSIVNQSYPNLEVLIQDGGSNDGTVDIIAKYAKKYPKIFKYESKKDKGQVDAINKGFIKATGEILTYINADDFYTANALIRVGKYFANNPGTLWVAGQGKAVNYKGMEIAEFATWYKTMCLKLNRYFLLLMTNYLYQPSVFFTREAYIKYGPLKGTNEYVLEYDFWLKLGKIKMPAVLRKTLSAFRISGTNISSISYSKLLEDDYNLVQKYTKNPLVLFLHKINNFGRVATIHFLK